MIEIANTGKHNLILDNPIIIASGMMGYDASAYRDLIKLEKLGAMVTNAISWKSRTPARGSRVVSGYSGFLLHTGLPNAGMQQTIKRHHKAWSRSPLPIIVHVIATNFDEVERCADELERVQGIVGIELGLHEQALADDVQGFVSAARRRTQLPLLLKLPLYHAPYLAEAAEDAGADAIVVASPPRGTDRDPHSGQLVGGRIYGPWLKAQTLRFVGQIASRIEIPIIACGGVHTSADARDYIDAGAKAVQIDTLLWKQPSAVEIIARNVGGLELTRAVGALADEWEPGIGKTQMMKRSDPKPKRPISKKPPAPPELPLGTDEMTAPTDSTQYDDF